MRGLGTVLTMMFLNQAAIRSVPPSQASDASGLYNGLRNLGGSIALACIATLQEQRLWLHSRRIEDTLPANAAGVQDYIAGQATRWAARPPPCCRWSSPSRCRR